MEANRDRLMVLERRVRRLQVTLVVLLAVGVVGMLMGADATGTLYDILRANKIVFRDSLTFETDTGRKIAVLEESPTGKLTLYDNAGRPVISMSACFNDLGGMIICQGKTVEKQKVQVNGQGLSIMGRPSPTGGVGTWMSLCRQEGLRSGLEIYGDGVEMIKLDNLAGVPKVEVIETDGKATSLVP